MGQHIRGPLFSELTNLGILMEEVGELARIMTRVYGDQSFKRKDEKHDLADVLFVAGRVIMITPS